MRKNEIEPLVSELIERRLQENRAQYDLAMSPVFAELRAAGINHATLAGLRTSGIRYDAAIPILLKWLPLFPELNIRRSILSALSVPWARTAVIQPLIREFLTWPNNDDGYKWSVGNAIELVADQSAFEQLLAIAGDRSNGYSRAMIVLWLGKVKDLRAEAMLIESLSDPSVLYCTVEALGKLKSVKARPLIEPLLHHHDSEIRRVARKAIAKIDRAHPPGSLGDSEADAVPDGPVLFAIQPDGAATADAQTWLCTHSTISRTARFRLELAFKPRLELSPFAAGTGWLLAEGDGDASALLSALANELEAGVSVGPAARKRPLKFDLVVLNTREALDERTDPWIRMKASVNDRLEFYLDLNPSAGTGAIHIKDEEYGDGLLKAFARAL